MTRLILILLGPCLTLPISDPASPPYYLFISEEYVSQIYSSHKNKHEDRRFKFACKKGRQKLNKKKEK